MKIIFTDKQYKTITEGESSFSYLDTDGENGNYRDTPNNEISAAGKDGDEYGKNPMGDTVAHMLAPQSFLRMQMYQAPKYPKNNISENEDTPQVNIDENLVNRLDYVINAINNKYRDGHTKAEFIYKFISSIDKTNISGEDKNKLRDLIMR